MPEDAREWAGGFRTGDKVIHQTQSATVVTPIAAFVVDETQVPIVYDGSTGFKTVPPDALTRVKK